MYIKCRKERTKVFHVRSDRISIIGKQVDENVCKTNEFDTIIKTNYY